MVSMMLVKQRPIEKEVKPKSDGKPIGALMGTINSKFDGTLMGTPNYTPPEFLSKRVNDPKYDRKEFQLVQASISQFWKN